MERMNANESSVTNVTCVTNVTNVVHFLVDYWLNELFSYNFFHTQRPFSVLTLLALGDEMYYICIEIWEEPRLPPFFVTFPLKTGVLGAHPVKICLPLILICLPLILIWGRQRKTARRIGKIGRRKVFQKVKNVNVELLKFGSNLLVFSACSFLFPLHQCSWMGSSKRLSFFGGHELFWLGRHELILFELELFTNCSELTRQLMGINGETFLPRSAPK